jgi:hypothetical protein
MESVEALQGILEGLLEERPLLCRPEGVSRGNGTDPRAIVAVASQLRELGIHPDVDVEAIRNLMPWHYLCVHPGEMVVTGYRDDPELFGRAHGDLVEFLGYVDEARGLVRVSHLGHEERIVTLAPPLRERELRAPAQLVLQRDNDRWAIDVVPQEHRESRFEISVDGITTSLDDLAGLDPVVEVLVEDALLRLVRPDLLTLFGTGSLKGVILESHKPGQGKTAMIRAYAAYLRDLGGVHDFEVALYYVPPGGLTTVWHGGDSKLVREDLCGAIRARQMRPRSRPLIQLVVLDEIDSLGKRSGEFVSPAGNAAVTALLSEMDGIMQWQGDPEQPPPDRPCGQRPPPSGSLR